MSEVCPERLLSSVFDDHIPFTNYHSISRLSDVPTRLSGWFHHAFNSSCHRSIPASRQLQLRSPQNTEGHLDKAMCYLLDYNTIPGAYNDPIWLLGV